MKWQSLVIIGLGVMALVVAVKGTNQNIWTLIFGKGPLLQEKQAVPANPALLPGRVTNP